MHLTLSNLDINLICERPKVSKFRGKITKSLSSLLNLSEELINLKGMNNKMLALLAENSIYTLDDFADLATYDLMDKNEGIFKELDIEEKTVNDMIMKAREKWFKDEQQ